MKRIFYLFIILLGLFIGNKIATFSPAPHIVRAAYVHILNRNALPDMISITKLGINSKIESVGEDKDNNMDVPKNTDNAAWYKFGSLPGESGNTVIAGHYDSKTGPALFYNLSSLAINDEILIQTKDGKTHRYIVVNEKTYDEDEFPSKIVFRKNGPQQLVLITCGGSFDKGEQTYSHRVVVFAKPSM